jgi:hypothetical protein
MGSSPPAGIPMLQVPAVNDSLPTSFPEPHEGGLVLASGVFGIAMAGGCAPVGVAFGLLAAMFGLSDLRKMTRGDMDNTGRGLTLVGLACGIAAAVIGAVTLCDGMAIYLSK